MAILNQKRILNLIPKTSAPVTIHVSQGDVGTEIEFTLVKGDELFVNTGSLSASVHGVREDGANFGVFTCTLSGSSVKFPLHAEMTAVKGSAIAEIVLVDSQGNKVGSANFGIMVEESVFPLGVTYDNDVSVYESILAYVQAIPAQIEADISTVNTALMSEIGAERRARQNADASLSSRIDNLVAPSGEAPSAAEIIDARDGVDGTTYSSLGTAIRTQVGDAMERVIDLQDSISRMANISKEILDGNCVDAAIPKNTTSVTLRLTHDEYSGININGTVPYNSATGISELMDITIEAGEAYTIFVVPKTKNITYDFTFSMNGTGGWVINDATGGVFNINPNMNAPTILIPRGTVTNPRLYIYQNQHSSGYAINATFYVYILKGEYKLDDFVNGNSEALNDLVLSTFGNMKFPADNQLKALTFKQGGSYVYSGFVPDSAYGYTDFIPCVGKKFYYLNVADGTGIKFVFYDSNHDAINNIIDDVRAVAPSNAVYMRISATKAQQANICLTEDFEYVNKVVDIFSDLNKLSETKDNLRENNLFVGCQPGMEITVGTENLLAIRREGYNGLGIRGQLAYREGTTASEAKISELTAGKKYTMYIESKSGDIGNGAFVFAINGTGGYVTENGINRNFNPALGDVDVFTPDNTVTNARMYVYQSVDVNGLDIDDVFYIYLYEGIHTLDEIKSSDIAPISYRQKVITDRLTVGLPLLSFIGDISNMTKDNSVTLKWNYQDSIDKYNPNSQKSGNCTVKWQGASSVAYEKKNYSVKFDNAIDLGWGAQKKYVLKANYIDATSALNLCGANIWADIVEDRGEHPSISVAANNGAMDGFPVIVMLNGEFHGLYTLNTPKDKWTFGMGSGANEYIVTSEQVYPSTRFRALTDLDGTDFELEYAPSGVDESVVKDSMNQMLSAVINSTGVNWEESVNPYLDVDTAIDYMIFSGLIGNLDGLGKNYILTTYDGVKWYFNAYDLDSIFGNNWMGGNYVSSKHATTSFAGMDAYSRIFHLIYAYSKSKLIARYDELRGTILSEDEVMLRFYNFCGIIPSAIAIEDNKKWNQKSGTYTNTLERIMNWYRLRVAFMDAEIDALRS